jgi:hypothetical protein
MRLISERGGYPPGGVPNQYHIDSHIRTDLAGQVGPDGRIQRLFAELTVPDRQMRQALAFASALVLGRIW